MTSIQRQFLKFHETIKADDTGTLREKRDIVVNKIREKLKSQGHPIPQLINQGSYIYGVGIKPTGSEEYDIDVGLAFDMDPQTYDPKEVRSWVYNAINDHTNKVENRGACIRVYYTKGYHVDLVCYAKYGYSDSDILYLAHRDGNWKPANPIALKKFINEKRVGFEKTKENNGADQLQRVTRYLKRWNDLHFQGDSKRKPSGLALLLLVISKLKLPAFTIDGSVDDLQALISVTQISNYGRIIVMKPTPEHEDVFGALTPEVMESFKEKMLLLHNGLLVAKKSENVSDACQVLNKYFGEDFPILTKDTAAILRDMEAAIPSYPRPSRPWSNGL